MNEEQFSELKILVESTMKLTVNGKIDRLQEAFDIHATEDKAWKDTAQPALDTVNNARIFGKVALYLVGVVGVLSGAIYTIIKIFGKK